MTDNFKDVIENNSRNHYNVRDEFKNNTVEDNKKLCLESALPFAVGALSITGDLNIGIMIRTASLLGASDFFIFGRKKYDKRSTVGAENYINVHRYTSDDIYTLLDNPRWYPVFVEHGGVELPLSTAEWGMINSTMTMVGDRRPIFIFGSESNGIPEEVLNAFEYYPKISLPQCGVLRSFNVSTAMSLVCWEYSKHVLSQS